MQRKMSTELAYVFGVVFVALGVVMSFLVFGLWRFEGVKAGTILCALVNGWIIGRFSAFYESHWTFYDRFPWRRFFAPEETGERKKTGDPAY